MSILKKLALAATLSVAFMSSAQADSTTLLVNSFADVVGSTEQFYVVSDVPVPTSSTSTGFVDDFLLQVYDDQTFNLFLNATGVRFDSVQMYDFFDNTYDFSSLFVGDNSVLGNGLSLQSGLYDLEVTGSVIADGGSYSGALANVVAVPEPAQWALMLTGFGAFWLAVRRRAMPRR